MLSSVPVLVATFLPHFAASVTQSAVGPLAPFLQAAFGISRAQIGLFTTFQQIGMTFMAIPAGSLVERLGIRIWLLVCPLTFGICALLFSLSTSFYQGLLAFLLGSLVAAFVNPATTKAILVSFPGNRRGTAIGIKHTGYPAGGFIASIALPSLAIACGWQASMVVAGMIAIFSGILAWFLYAEIDGVRDRANGWQREAFQQDVGRLLRNRNFVMTSLLQGVFHLSTFILYSYSVLYFVEALGYTPIRAGLILATTQISGSLGRVFWGMVSDFLFAGRRIPTMQLIGYFTFLGLVGLALLSAAAPVWLVFLVSSVAGAGSIGFSGTTILLRAELAGKDLAATATGMGIALSSWGVLFGPPLFGLAVDATHSYRIAWLAVALLALAATLMLGLIKEPRAAAPGERA